MHACDSQSRASTANGRCETALTRWFGVKSLWKGYGRKSSASFEFYVSTMLPRYHRMWKAWHGATDSCHQQVGLWGARGITNGGMMKGKVTSKHPFPESVYRMGGGKDVYGLFAYLKHTSNALSQVCVWGGGLYACICMSRACMHTYTTYVLLHTCVSGPRPALCISCAKC